MPSQLKHYDSALPKHSLQVLWQFLQVLEVVSPYLFKPQFNTQVLLFNKYFPVAHAEHKVELAPVHSRHELSQALHMFVLVSPK